MNSKTWLLSAAVLLTACGPESLDDDPDVLDSDTASIVGGRRDKNHPAVVALDNAQCTGTLISRKTVLTAGHCIGFASEVRFGTEAQRPTLTVRIARQVRHPSYGRGAADDLGLLELAFPVTEIAPIPIFRGRLAQNDVGRTVRHVGFGRTHARGSGTRMTVAYPIRVIRDGAFESGANGEQTCSGDSGGPGLIDTPNGERIAGVVSLGDARCRKTGWDARVDTDVAWIDATSAQWE